MCAAETRSRVLFATLTNDERKLASEQALSGRSLFLRHFIEAFEKKFDITQINDQSMKENVISY